eukprot:638039-Rhodomonas_salina.1
MSVLREAQGACKEDLMSRALSRRALLHICHPEGLTDACSYPNSFGACHRLSVLQLRLRRGR